MAKKNFKDNTANIDRFFTDPEFQKEAVSAVKAKFKTSATSDASETPATPQASVKSKVSDRFTLRLRPELKRYLEDAAWKSRKSINEYLNDLVEADMENGENT